MKIKILSVPKHSFADGGDTGNGITTFRGIQHGQFGLEGIPQGIASDGLPNFVEGGGFDKNGKPLEGEVKYKDYIYSNRLKPSKTLIKDILLPEKYAGLTYAKLAEKLQKESEDRPNDPISKTTLDEWMSRLANAQEIQKAQIEERRLAKALDNMPVEDKAALAASLMQQGQQGIDLGQPMYAEGGKIYIKPSKRGTFTAAAKKHGKSVQAFASQVLANKENYSPAMVKKANFARNSAKWHADGGHLFDAGGRKNPWEVGYLYDNGFLPYDIEATTVSPWDRRYITIQNNNRATGINLPEVAITPEEEQELKENITYPTFDNNQELVNNNYNSTINLENLRYAPAIGAGLGALTAALQPIDYSFANQLQELASRVNPIAAPHIGGYRRYNSYDVNLGDAENLAMQATTLRANRGQNRATQGALDVATINAFQRANAQRNLAAQQANEANRLNIDKYNLGINQFNTNLTSAYDQLNTNRLAQRLALEQAAIQAADVSKTAWANNINANTENFFNQLGNVGKDTWNANQYNKWLSQHQAVKNIMTGTSSNVTKIKNLKH